MAQNSVAGLTRAQVGSTARESVMSPTDPGAGSHLQYSSIMQHSTALGLHLLAQQPMATVAGPLAGVHADS